MKKALILWLGTVAVVMGCSQAPSEKLIRTDLLSKPLTVDDFSVIDGNRLVKAFNSTGEITALFPGIKGRESTTWRWSVFDTGSDSLRNVEYQARNMRFVYIREDINEYAGLSKGALTIRGVGIGDTIQKVLEAYGKNEWLEQHNSPARDLTKKGHVGFDYRLYNYPESADSKYPFFDEIYFEGNDGIVVGIHFWRKYSDAP